MKLVLDFDWKKPKHFSVAEAETSWLTFSFIFKKVGSAPRATDQRFSWRNRSSQKVPLAAKHPRSNQRGCSRRRRWLRRERLDAKKCWQEQFLGRDFLSCSWITVCFVFRLLETRPGWTRFRDSGCCVGPNVALVADRR